ncbi:MULTISPECIES: cation transporter [unclassified Olleya]|jgi:copper chaperone CopZ|uniref:cation transporter n=1 Tax=unclassified Olleya TaxID=2615019 RepID=UPI0011A2E7E3|nr:heavy metal-associated domain-containing protein [Olleya sp. Hel_I_94]TVZ47859.1 heavy-metal-associated domain-containing protein [Olleya sp. Hel_I_94]
MKSFKHILVLVAITVLTFSCKNEAEPEVMTSPSATETTEVTKKAEINPNAKLAKAEFKIEGMTCAMGCAKTIEKKMAKMEGVKSAIVDFDRELAMVEYDEALVTPASLETTVTSVADTYKVKDMHTVDAFSTAKKECTMKCKEDCTKKDCKDCAAKTAECKKKCANKTEAEKLACAKDCKKACCTDAKKA